MRIGKLVFRMRWKQADLKKRGKQASFGNFITASAELASAIKNPPTRDMAFIIPTGTTPEKTTTVNMVQQILVERFAVLVCLRNDNKQSEKYGFQSMDKTHTVRSEVMKSFLGWLPSTAETVIVYAGESLVEFTPSYLWYQYNFQYTSQLTSYAIEDGIVEGDIVDHGWQDVDPESPTNLNKIYAQIVPIPDAEGRIPLDPTQELPLPDGFPDVTLPDIAQYLEREGT